MDDSFDVFSSGPLSELTGTKTLTVTFDKVEWQNEVKADTFLLLHIKSRFFQAWNHKIKRMRLIPICEKKAIDNTNKYILKKLYSIWKFQLGQILHAKKCGLNILVSQILEIWDINAKIAQVLKTKFTKVQEIHNKYLQKDMILRYKYVWSLEKMSKQFSNNKDKIFLIRYLRYFQSVTFRIKRLRKIEQSLTENHEYFIYKSFFEHWIQQHALSRKKSKLIRIVKENIMGGAYDNWKSLSKLRRYQSNMLKKIVKGKEMGTISHYFHKWTTNTERKVHLRIAPRIIVRKRIARIQQYAFYDWLYRYDSRIRNRKNYLKAVQTLEDFNLQRVFYKWESRATVKRNRREYLETAHERLQDFKLHLSFVRWARTTAVHRFIYNLTGKYHQKTNIIYIKKFYNIWKIKFQTIQDARSKYTKAREFRHKSLQQKAFSCLHEYSKLRSNYKKSCRIARNFKQRQIQRRTLNKWLKLHRKIKFRVFLVTSVINEWQKSSALKAFRKLKANADRNKLKRQNEAEALAEFERRRRALTINAFALPKRSIIKEKESEFFQINPSFDSFKPHIFKAEENLPKPRLPTALLDRFSSSPSSSPQTERRNTNPLSPLKNIDQPSSPFPITEQSPVREAAQLSVPLKDINQPSIPLPINEGSSNTDMENDLISNSTALPAPKRPLFLAPKSPQVSDDTYAKDSNNDKTDDGVSDDSDINLTKEQLIEEMIAAKERISALQAAPLTEDGRKEIEGIIQRFQKIRSRL